MLQIDPITIQPVLPKDDNFIYEVYASTRADPISPVSCKTGFSANAVRRAAGTISVIFSASPP
ncbi:MAG TPA: hypothetical protein VLE49_15180 [Anaerolineales bacterium]|nr:hypothetical protein [Anaerolineales bacterium]